MVNSNIISSPTDMCALARNYYEDQFLSHLHTGTPIELEADRVDKELEENLKDICPPHISITYHHILKSIASLKNKNSTGIDGVSNRVLKLLPRSHLPIIFASFNTFASSFQTPSHWHVAKMILLSKKKSKIVSVDETRPISLLPCFSKLFEKCFLIQLRKWIDDQGILPDEQSGFRAGHNMAVRVIAIIDQIGQSLAKNTAAAALFVDFKSAFNQLWFCGLWLKLKRLECPLYLIAWLRHYLTGRMAYINIKNSRSNNFTLMKGVPQGSCIGPILFILYHYDILDSLSTIHWKHLFADDLAVLFSPSSMLSSAAMILDLIEQVKDVLDHLIKYSTKWKQAINFNKTQWILFHRQVAPRVPDIDHDGHHIERVSKFKYLGMFLDAKLSLTTHIDYIKNKIRTNLNIFKRLAASRMMSEQVSYKLFNAYIRPYYQTLLNIFPILSTTKQKQLEALNRQIFRTIHRWYDARNIEIENLPKFKPISSLVDLHWNKLINTILRTNPSIIEDFLQHKLSILYLREYLTNPSLITERRNIFDKGRTRNNIISLIYESKPSLLDHVLCF